MDKDAIKVENLCVFACFLRSTEKIVGDVSFCLKSGERLAIVGESGSGKSMIVNSLTASLADNCFATGEIVVDDTNLLENPKKAKAILGRQLVFIPQGGAESLNPSLKIKTQIYEAFSRSGLKLTREQKRAYSVYNLARAGLKNGEVILEKYPFEISGGEAQRVVLAIAMCATARLIVADEATRGIDKETSEAFWACMDKDFADTALIIVTHDMTVAKKCDYVLVLKDGCVQEYGKTCEVFSNPKSEYAKSLISACEVSYA